MQVTYNVLTPNIKHPYKLICLSESMLHLVLKGLKLSMFLTNIFRPFFLPVIHLYPQNGVSSIERAKMYTEIGLA